MIYAITIPFALVLGYILTSPTDFSSFFVLMATVFTLAVPLLIRWHHAVLIFTWNEFLFATLLTGRYILPFPKAVPGMTIGVFEPNWAAVCALGIMVAVPIMVLSFYMQKYIVRGMTYGAIRE